MIRAGAQQNANSPITCNGGICKGEANGRPFVILGLASWLTTGIWSIIDANKVAKVNSQYEKSKNEKPISITPNVGMINNQGDFVPAMGISFKF